MLLSWTCFEDIGRGELEDVEMIWMRGKEKEIVRAKGN